MVMALIYNVIGNRETCSETNDHSLGSATQLSVGVDAESSWDHYHWLVLTVR